MSILQFVHVGEREVQVILLGMFVYEIIVGFIMDVIMVYAFAGYYDYMIVYAILGIVAESFNMKYLYPRKAKYLERVYSKFAQDAYEHYSQLSYNSRQTRTLNKFVIEVNALDKAIRALLNETSKYLFELVRTLLVICFYCYVQPDWRLLLSVAATYVLITQCVIIAKYKTEFDQQISNAQKYGKRMQLKLNIAYSQFDLNETTTKAVVRIRSELAASEAKVDRYRYYSQFTQEILKRMGIVIMYTALWFKANIGYYLRFQSLHQHLTTVAVRIIGIHTYIRYAQDAYTSYQTFFEGGEFIEQMPQYDYDEKPLALVSCDIRIENFQLIYSSATQISLGPGERIRVFGANGNGKSSLLRALNGEITGVILNNGIPLNYINTICMMPQNIIGTYASANITIRDYFKDEPRNDVIDQYIRAIFNGRAYTKIMTMYSSFDADLANKLSTGEKMMMIIAAKCYEIWKFNKRIIIMDEIDMSLDQINIKRIMTYIFETFTNCVIIAASHRCDHRKFGLRWTAHLRVKDQSVQRVVYKLQKSGPR